jgi:hypothetical protein
VNQETRDRIKDAYTYLKDAAATLSIAASDNPGVAHLSAAAMRLDSEASGLLTLLASDHA